MTLKEYFLHLDKEPHTPLPELDEKTAEGLYKEIKDLFFDFYSNKWKGIKECEYQLSLGQVRPAVFIILVEHIFQSYFGHFPRAKGKKGTQKFIATLKKSEMFNRMSNNSHLMKLQSEQNVKDFIKDMQIIKDKYLITKEEDFIKLLHHNFNTGYTYSSFRRMYFILKE